MQQSKYIEWHKDKIARPIYMLPSRDAFQTQRWTLHNDKGVSPTRGYSYKYLEPEYSIWNDYDLYLKRALNNSQSSKSGGNLPPTNHLYRVF